MNSSLNKGSAINLFYFVMVSFVIRYHNTVHSLLKSDGVQFLFRWLFEFPQVGITHKGGQSYL